MKLRLFTLRSGAQRSTEFFSDKSAAKKRRDELNELKPSTPWVVTPGPDHHRYAGK